MRAWSSYVGPLLLLKISEFAACVALASALFFAFPVPPYIYNDESITVLEAIRAGAVFSGWFFVLTLYPVVSALVLLIAVALKVRSRLLLAMVAGLFLLAYTAAWVIALGAAYPSSFWVAWGAMGLLSFVLALSLLPGGDETEKEEAGRRAR